MAGKHRTNPVSDDQIVAEYRQCQSSYKVASKFGIGAATVERVLTKRREPRPGLTVYRASITKYQGSEAAMLAAYEAGATLAELKVQFGAGSDYAVKHAIRRAGGALRQNPAPLVKPGEAERIRELHDRGMGQVAISIEIGRSQTFVSRLMRRHGIARHPAKGSKHSMWRGGRMRAGAYVRVHVEDDDPLAAMRDASGYVLEHRLEIARSLGRVLLKTETVHHINGDGTDNRLENLQLRQGKHGKHVVMCCRDCGSQNVGPAPLK